MRRVTATAQQQVMKQAKVLRHSTRAGEAKLQAAGTTETNKNNMVRQNSARRLKAKQWCQEMTQRDAAPVMRVAETAVILVLSSTVKDVLW